MPVSSRAVATGERVFDFTLQPLSNDGDRVEAVVVFAIDVTDQVRSRKELELAREQAERASQAKDNFLAVVSHELRTPLSSILGWAVLARRRSAPVDPGRALEVIERSARTQARLVDDILDLSRIVGGKLRLDMARTDLGRVIVSAVDSLRPAAAAKGVTLSIGIGDLGQIEADADRIQQVVWNLLSNAIKFTTRGGRTQVTASRRDSWAVIRVDDTGEGIESSSIPDLFRPFWQADTSTTRNQGGLGLGLAIVSQIVHAHGGTITAGSEGKGRGTSMVVESPVGSAPEAPTSRRRISRSVVTWEPSFRLDDLRVLVVDDDEDARLLLGEIFADRGARVTCASSAFEAIEELRRGHPDVVISDIGMPGMDGFTLIRAIRLPRDEGGCTPAIALTAHARADDVDSSARRRLPASCFQARRPDGAARIGRLAGGPIAVRPARVNAKAKGRGAFVGAGDFATAGRMAKCHCVANPSRADASRFELAATHQPYHPVAYALGGVVARRTVLHWHPRLSDALLARRRAASTTTAAAATGLARNASQPASIASRTSAFEVKALTARITISLAPSRSRTQRATLKPSIRGNIKSRMMRTGSTRCTCWMPVSPSFAQNARKPAASNSSANRSRESCSSSITTARGPGDRGPEDIRPCTRDDRIDAGDEQQVCSARSPSRPRPHGRKVFPRVCLGGERHAIRRHSMVLALASTW